MTLTTHQAAGSAQDWGPAPTTSEGWIERAHAVANQLSVDAVARDRAGATPTPARWPRTTRACSRRGSWATPR